MRRNSFRMWFTLLGFICLLIAPTLAVLRDASVLSPGNASSSINTISSSSSSDNNTNGSSPNNPTTSPDTSNNAHNTVIAPHPVNWTHEVWTAQFLQRPQLINILRPRYLEHLLLQRFAPSIRPDPHKLQHIKYLLPPKIRRLVSHEQVLEVLIKALPAR